MFLAKKITEHGACGSVKFSTSFKESSPKYLNGLLSDGISGSLTTTKTITVLPTTTLLPTTTVLPIMKLT